MSDTVILYHGTCDKGKEKILSEGLNPLSCMTSDIEVAQYYAECAAEESDEPPVILSMLVPKTNLKVDYNSFEEPLSYFKHEYTRSDSEWREMIESGEIPYPKDEFDFQTSLDVVWSVRCINRIDKSEIWEEA